MSELSRKEQEQYSAELRKLVAERSITGLDPDEQYKLGQRVMSKILACREQSLEQGLLPDVYMRNRMAIIPRTLPVIPSRKLAPLSNWLAKTSVFAPRKKIKGRLDTGVEWKTLPSPRGIDILYNGPDLDMADQTLFLNLIKLAEGRGANEPIHVNRADLLKRCGYKILGMSSYDWLSGAIDRLKQANIRLDIHNLFLQEHEGVTLERSAVENTVVEYKTGRKMNRTKVTIGLLGTFQEKPDTGEYYFVVPPEVLILFSGNLFGYNDLDKRIKIFKGRRGELAAWLQSYICAEHPGRHEPVRVETLHKLSASKSRMSDFIKRINEALDNCKSAGVITDWEMSQSTSGESMIAWERE